MYSCVPGRKRKPGRLRPVERRFRKEYVASRRRLVLFKNLGEVEVGLEN